MAKVKEGWQRLALMLEGMPPAQRETLLAQIGQDEPALAQWLSENSVSFKSVLTLGQRELAVLLSGFSDEQIAVALKGLTPSQAEALLVGVSRRRATQIAENLLQLPPMRRSDVEVLRDEIVKRARELEQAGKLSFNQEPMIR